MQISNNTPPATPPPRPDPDPTQQQENPAVSRPAAPATQEHNPTQQRAVVPSGPNRMPAHLTPAPTTPAFPTRSQPHGHPQAVLTSMTSTSEDFTSVSDLRATPTTTSRHHRHLTAPQHPPAPAEATTTPAPHTGTHQRRQRSHEKLLRKEVIQPHLPVRLPCYDFVPIASPTFDHSLPEGLGHGLRVLPTFVT
jgi:hypothetical protein